MKFGRDDRAVSIAITHVLTVGITAVLISGLLIGAGSMLDTQREQSAEATLETIGERLAGEISGMDRMASENSESATIRTDHQRFASGSQYTVELRDSGCDIDEYPLVETSECLVLTSHGEDVNVAVPIADHVDVRENSSVTGGPIQVVWDDGITLEDQP
ncbi:DUF7266 family protein [Halovivax gelatinilyticus]|uniref:DUF7266 family protein n=1 Tax=Halovivax gelatinilyticus TaxID=2961597 RepID=UPI0020CA35CD|nr:hypothetical protein [Halovivax gelatinilyticus]